MIIKFILSFALLIFLLYAIVQRATSRVISRFVLLTVVFGVYFVWFPEQSMVIANFVGVGRGVDLIFYCLFVLGLIAVFGVYLRLTNLNSMVTRLARHVALSGPLIPGDEKAAGEDTEMK